MKYGIILIILSIINFFTIFSGFPNGWKKFIITTISILVLFIGWILRSIAIKKKLRAEKRVREMNTNESFNDSLDSVAEVIAEDITEQVEADIDSLTDESRDR